MEFLSFCDSTFSRVKNESIELLTVDIEKKELL